MVQKAKRQDYISNLSSDLIAQALELIQEKSFSVYRKNIHQRNPPFAHGEFASAAIVLLTAGLDFHLARLKFFRDVAKTKPALPHTPYFNWNIGTYLYDKIDKLLYKRTEKRLKEQLIELTAMRDSVAHPKLYLVSSLLRHDATTSPETAKLVGEESHRAKTLKRKLKRSERTVSLRLPLVPSWISYVDIVLCVLVLTRFFNLLEERYGTYHRHTLTSVFAKSSPTKSNGSLELTRRFQVVIATTRAKASDGVRQPSVCRGRPFNSAAMRLSCGCV